MDIGANLRMKDGKHTEQRLVEGITTNPTLLSKEGGAHVGLILIVEHKRFLELLLMSS